MPAAIPLVVLAGSALAGGLAAGGVILAGTASLISIGLSVVGTLASVLLAPTPPTPPKPQFADGKQTIRQPLPPRVRCYGRFRLGGGVFYYGGGDNLLVGTVHASHQIDAIEEFWLADKLVIVDEDGHVQSSPYQVGPGPGRITIETHVGTTDQAASPTLLAESAVAWTADHRLRGLANSVTTYRDADPEHQPEVFPNGPPPLTLTIRGAMIYDPRLEPDGDQVGGPFPPRAFAPRAFCPRVFPPRIVSMLGETETYLWSDNLALVILDYLTRREGADGEVPIGFGLPESRIDTESFILSADVCEELVTLKAGGSEQRWRCSGAYQLSEDRKQVLNDLLMCCQGRLTTGPDGRIGLSVGAPGPVAAVTIQDEQVIRYDLASGVPQIRRINEVKASYISEAHDWQEVEAGGQRDQAEIERSGGTEPQPVKLRFCPSEGQAQRIARAELRRANPRWAGTITGTLALLDAWGERWVQLVLDELAISSLFEVQSIALDRATMTVQMRVQSYDRWFEWRADRDEADPAPVPDPEEEGETRPDAPTGVSVVLDPRGNATTRVVVAVVSWDPAGNPVGRYRARMRWRASGATWRIVDADQEEDEAETSTLVDGEQYETEVSYIGQRGVASDWSATELFTATVDPVAPDPPSGFTAVLAAGVDDMVTLTATAPGGPHFVAMRFYRDTGATFATEVQVGGIFYAAPLQTVVYVDNPAAGTWWYRARAENASGVQSTPTAGSSVTTAS